MNTIRKRILVAIRRQLETLADLDLGEGEEYPWAFSSVEDGPLRVEANKRRVAGVLAGTEKKAARFPLTDCELPVTIEFQTTINRGDQVPAMEAEDVIGVIQKRILEDTTLGGLVIDIREIGNAVDLTDYGDKTVEGAVTFIVLYRHSVKNPETTV